MMHIPMQKWNGDKTLADYIQRKTDTPPKKTFDEWLDEPYFELNERSVTRRSWWTDSEIDAASKAWEEARK